MPIASESIIPTEAVGFWLAVSGLIQSAAKQMYPKVRVALALVRHRLSVHIWLDPSRYHRAPGKPTAWTQIWDFLWSLYCLGVCHWRTVCCLLGPSYKPLYGSLLLITYTAAVSFVIPPEK